MTMSKKVMVASILVACLFIASLGAVAPTNSEGSAAHYVEIDSSLNFYGSEGDISAFKINEAVGDAVCEYAPSENKLIFIKSVALDCVSNKNPYFMEFGSQGDNSKSIIEIQKDVAVTLKSGGQYSKDSTLSNICVIKAFGPFMITGEGSLTVILDGYNGNKEASALSFHTNNSDPLQILGTKVLLEAEGNAAISCSAYGGYVGGKDIELTNGANLSADGKYVVRSDSFVSVNIENSSVCLRGTDSVGDFSSGSLIINNTTGKVYASTDYRGVNNETYNGANILSYRYITTEYHATTGLVTPLIVIISIICVIILIFLLFYKENPPYINVAIASERAMQKEEAKKVKAGKKVEQDKILAEQKAVESAKAEKAKKEAAEKRAEKDRIYAEQEKQKIAQREEAKKAKQAQKAEQQRLKEEQKAKAAQAKIEAQQAAEAQKAAEAKQREEARQAAEAQKAAEAKQREEARQAAEAQKLAEKKAAEEKRAAELKAAQERKAAEAKQREDAKRAEAEKKAAEKRAIEEQKAAKKRAAEEKKAQEAKQRAEAEAKREAERKAAQRKAAEKKAAEKAEAEKRAKEKAAEKAKRDAEKPGFFSGLFGKKKK